MPTIEPTEVARLPSHPSFLSRKYFSSLDVFRFVAIVAVIWHHTEPGTRWLPAISRGFLGVDFFFVISGFLIVTLLLRERDRTGAISLRQFYLRRSLRIFPIYYGLIAALTAVILIARPHTAMAQAYFRNLPYQLAYLSNLVSNAGTILFFTWSLATEEQFYLVWPPIEKWLKGAAVPVLLGVIAVNQALNFGLLNRFFGDHFLPDRAIFQITFTPICLGVLLAHVLHGEASFRRAVHWLGQPWSSPVALALLLLVLNYPNPDLMGWPRLAIQVAMTLLLGSCVIREDNAVNRLLGFRWVRRIGVISYGVYLYHEFLAIFTHDALGRLGWRPPLASFALTLILSVAVAELSFRFYETPFLRLKDRIGYGLARRPAPERAEERVAR